jgi:archaellum biogenesis ATPase FlaH
VSSLSSLISASLSQHDVSYLERVPAILLSDADRAALQWIVRYTHKWKKPPTVERYRDTEHGVYLTHHLASSPIGDVFEQTLQALQRDFFFARFHEIEAEMGAGEALSVPKIIQLSRDLASVNVEEDDSLFTVDRDEIYDEDAADGLHFGYDVLDTATGGIQKGEYALLVARTGVGKTLITCHLALKWAREGKKVLVISCEMPTKQMIARLDAMIANFNSRMLRTRDNPALLKVMRDRVEKELETIKAGGGDIIFPKSRSISVTKLRGIIADRRPDVVIVDGVYLLRSDDAGSASSDWARLKAASNELKQICLELDLPVFATSQLKRTGKDDSFTLEDIAYSDALGQDTDLVLVANKFAGVVNQLTLEILKNRHGDGYGGTVLQIDWERSTLTERSLGETVVALGGSPVAALAKSVASGADPITISLGDDDDVDLE